MFSPNGTTWGFKASKIVKEYMVINGKAIGTYDEASECLFSPNGSKWAFVFRAAKYHLNATGKEQGALCLRSRILTRGNPYALRRCQDREGQAELPSVLNLGCMAR